MTTATIWTSNSHGQETLKVTFDERPNAQRAALEFLQRTTKYVVGQPYRVVMDVEIPDEVVVIHDLMEFLSPTCEHGMSLSLCMGPDHFPSREQEMERGW